LNVVCRGGTRDWDIVHELFFAGSYSRAAEYIRLAPGEPQILDLGGNIGLFALLMARANQNCHVTSFEPGPPNSRLFEMNRLANPQLTQRISLRKQAVGGQTRSTEWFFDEKNPGGSGLFNREGQRYDVEIVSFADVISSMPSRIALAKIDIEGAEYEVLANTPPDVWKKIDAISLELHDPPAGPVSQAEFLSQMVKHGFSVQEETVCSYFLHR
jgi:FkbM family methyltransferase